MTKILRGVLKPDINKKAVYTTAKNKKNCFDDDKKIKKNKKKAIAEHRAAAHTAAKALTQKPNAAVRRQRNRSVQAKKKDRSSIK